MRCRPSLSTYAQIKLRLEREAYLADGPGPVTVGSRRAIMDMARLRCGTHDLAISAARRQWTSSRPARRAGPGPVPRVERVCDWCAERLALPHMQAVASGRRVPVESEEHAVLWCGLYEAARIQLFQEVRQLTERRDAEGRCVFKQGPVDLEEFVASGPVDGPSARSALAFVLGGPDSEVSAPAAKSGAAQLLHRQLLQSCESFVGVMVRQRRDWRRLQSSSRDRLRPGATLDSWLRQAPAASADSARLRRRQGRRVRSGASGGGRRRPVSRPSRGAPSTQRASRPQQHVHEGRSRQQPIVRYLSLSCAQ